MALREFVDLGPANLALAQAAQRQVDPLTALIQGFQGGVDIGQIPQQLEAQRLSQQLALALQRERLADVLDPNRAVAREFQRQLTLKSLDPASGITRAPVGLESEVIATPRALVPGEQSFLEAGGDPAELRSLTPPGPSIRPLLGPRGEATGFSYDPTISRDIQRQKIGQEVEKLRQTEEIRQGFALERIKATADARGFKTYINPQDPNDILTLRPTEQPPEGFVDASVYLRGSRQRGTGGAGGVGGLKTRAEVESQFTGGVNLLGQIDDTLQVVERIGKEGKFPDALDVGLNQFLARRPQDMPGANLIPGIDIAFSTIQNLARGAQTKESRELQRKKAIIGSTILRTQAGLSQTLGEAINISPYTPSESDTYESLVEKLRELQNEGRRSLRNLRRFYPDLAQFDLPELGESPTPTPAGATRYLPGTILDQEEGGVIKSYKVDQNGVLQEM